MVTLLMLVILIVFASSLVRATFGFGDALVAMPLLTLALGVKTATPIVGLIATSLGLLMLWTRWQGMHVGAAWRLVLASAFGSPIGALMVNSVPEEFVRVLLGIILILVGVYSAFQPPTPRLHHVQWAYLFGFIAGILGGAYNANGPPVVIYGTLRRWTPDKFRATLQGYFLPSSIFILAGHGLSGLWTARVFQFYAAGLPAVLLAVWLGALITRRLNLERWRRMLYALLVLLGVLLIV